MQLTPEQEAAFRQYLEAEKVSQAVVEEFNRIAEPLREKMKQAIEATHKQGIETFKHLAQNDNDTIKAYHNSRLYSFTRNSCWVEEVAQIVSNDPELKAD